MRGEGCGGERQELECMGVWQGTGYPKSELDIRNTPLPNLYFFKR
jgi:hypothetical protein